MMPQLQLWASGPPDRQGPALAHLPHVLLVVDCLPVTLGGGERIALRIADQLPSAGFRVSLLTFSVHDGCSFKPEEAPCPIYLLPLKKTYGAHALKAAVSYTRFLRRERVQVVQTFFESSDLWAGLVTRLSSRARLIWSRRDMGILRQPKHQTAYRLLRRLPHAVFAVSARVAEHAAVVDGVPRDRIHVVYNGLDIAAMATPSTETTAGPLVVTTIGNVRHVKGHDLLVEAAARVLQRYPKVQFTVAGDILEPDYMRTLQQRIQELGIGASFHFLGRIQNLRAHLDQANLFVLPSRSEGFSNALIEAMACGLPVLATDVGGNAEAVQDRQNGRIVPSEDPEALTTALLELLADSRLRDRLGLAAQKTVRERFTITAMLHQTVEVYRKILEQ